MSKYKWLIIFNKEYVQTVRTKAFILSTLLMPLVLILLMGLPTYLQKKTMEKVKTYQVLDESGSITEVLAENLPGTMVMVSWDASKDEGVAAVRNGEIETFLYFPKNIKESYEFEYYSRAVSDSQRITLLQSIVSRTLQREKISKRGFTEGEINELLKKADVRTFEVSKAEGTKKKSASMSFLVAYILVFLIYISVLTWAPMMLRSTIEDKNNRVVEVVVSHVKSGSIMAGKIIGTAAAGITQYIIWGVMVAGTVKLLSLLLPGFKAGANAFFAQVKPDMFIYFIIYFILGYLVYSVVFAALGAQFSDMKDAQNSMGPIIMLAVLPLVLFMPVSQDPESTMAVVISQIPYLSSLMLMRIGISHVPASQIALSIILQMVTIVVEIWIAGKIYRIGIMSYGKKPSLKEVFSWLK